jgi:hypothetical protein
MLTEAGIESFVFEPNIGALWPGAFAARLMVADRDGERARQAIAAADPRELWR